MPSNYRPDRSVLPALLAAFVISLFFTDGLSRSARAAGFQEAPPTEEQQKEEKKARDKSAQDDSKKPSQAAGDQERKETESRGEGASRRDPESSRRSRRRQSRFTANSRAAGNFLEVFRPAIADAARATVEVKSGDDTIALGAIVDADGFVLTKQSELQRPLACRLNDGRTVAAYVYGLHPETDLALLKVEADNLPVVPWAEPDSLDIGQWLVTVKDADSPLAVGVVGVKARRIKPESGFMGVNLRQTERGVEIINVTEDSPAETGGLRRGDIITKVNGESFTEIDKLIPRVKSYPPGEEIRLTLLRNDKEIIADVVLCEERSLNPLYERSNQQNTMGGNELSKRRQNFPLAVQHDSFLKPEQCGGPVVNIDGQVVGINIARQGRVSSLMLPVSLVREVIDELKTGQWTPAVVNKDRIDEINRILQELTTQVALSPMNDDSLQKEVSRLSRDEQQLREKLEQALRERIRAEVRLEQAKEGLKSAQQEIDRLKKEREKLVTGTR
jgi:serine protease Do